jgi:hypothetical protein
MSIACVSSISRCRQNLENYLRSLVECSFRSSIVRLANWTRALHQLVVLFVVVAVVFLLLMPVIYMCAQVFIRRLLLVSVDPVDASFCVRLKCCHRTRSREQSSTDPSCLCYQVVTTTATVRVHVPLASIRGLDSSWHPSGSKTLLLSSVIS